MTSRAAAVRRFLFLSCRSGGQQTSLSRRSASPRAFYTRSLNRAAYPRGNRGNRSVMAGWSWPSRAVFFRDVSVIDPAGSVASARLAGIRAFFPLTANTPIYHIISFWFGLMLTADVYVRGELGPHAVNVRRNVLVWFFYSVFFFSIKNIKFQNNFFYSMTHRNIKIKPGFDYIMLGISH